MLLFLNGVQSLAADTAKSQRAEQLSHQPIVTLKDSYHDNHKDGNLAESASDCGNDEAIRTLLDKECDVVVISRRMRKEEIVEAENRGMEIKEAVAGWTGIAVMVHPANPINELTVYQVCKIIAGEYRMWRNVGGPAHPISIAWSGTCGRWIVDYFAQTFLETHNVQTVLQTNPSSDGPHTITLMKFEEGSFQSKTKILAIKKDVQSEAIYPSGETVDCGTYPFRVPLRVYADWKNATDVTKAFFNFCSNRTDRRPCK